MQGDPLGNAHSDGASDTVRLAPLDDQTAQDVIWEDSRRFKRGARLGARQLLLKPALNLPSLVCVAVAGDYRVFHELMRNGAEVLIGWLWRWCRS